MRAKDFNTGLRGVLFEAKHHARMGAAVWLYGWLVLRQTRQAGATGLVLGGRPVSYREIEDETGFPRRTLERWMRVLRRAGYVETQAVPAGVIVRITKAKKFPQDFPTLGHNERRFGRTGSTAYERQSRDNERFAAERVAGNYAEAADSPRHPDGRAGSADQAPAFASVQASATLAEADAAKLGALAASLAAGARRPAEGPTESRGDLGEHSREPKEFAGGIGSNTGSNTERSESRKPAFERSLPKTEPHEPGPPSGGGRFARRETREELVRRELQVGAGPEVRRK